MSLIRHTCFATAMTVALAFTLAPAGAPEAEATTVRPRQPVWRLVRVSGPKFIRKPDNVTVTFPRKNQAHLLTTSGPWAGHHSVVTWSDPPGIVERNQDVRMALNAYVVKVGPGGVGAAIQVELEGSRYGVGREVGEPFRAGAGNGSRGRYAFPGRPRFRFWDEPQVRVDVYLTGGGTLVLLASYTYQRQ